MTGSRATRSLLAVLIVAGTLIAYGPALRAGYIWDDDAYVTENRTLESLDGLRRIWLEPSALPQYYPLVHTGFWIERHLWGLRPFGYHLVNVLLHALNALLLWWALERLSVRGAWLAAALFALHPVHVESVAWITERKNVLSGVFYLAALLCLLRFYGTRRASKDGSLPAEPGTPDARRQAAPGDSAPLGTRHRQRDPARTGAVSGAGARPSPRSDADREHPGRARASSGTASGSRERPHGTKASALRERNASAPGEEPHEARWYAAGAALYLCALLSKTVSASLPVALLIVLWWKRDRLRWQEMLPLGPLLAAGGVMGFMTAWIEKHHVGAKGEIWSLSVVERCLVAGRALWFYLGKLLWPAKLAFFYPRWSIDGGSLWQFLFPLTALASVALLWSLRGRIGKGPLAGALFFVVTLVPALGFFDVFPMRYSYVADHFQYLASAGPIALVAALGAALHEALGRRWGRPYGIGSESVAIGEGGPGPERVGPSAPLAKGRSRASAPLERRGSHGGSSLTLLTGLAVAVPLLALGVLTWRQSAVYRDAETLWRDTIAKNPGAWMAHNNLGIIHDQRGETREAAAEYALALSQNPEFIEAYNNLGNVEARQGRMAEAADAYAEAVRRAPDYILARVNLGAASLQLGRNADAIEHLSAALRMEPAFLQAREMLATALGREGRIEEAKTERAEALRFKAWIRATHEDPALRSGEEAIALAERACQLTNFGQPLPLDALAAAYAESGRFAEAVETARKALALAESSAKSDLARQIQDRLRLYESGRPFRDPSVSRIGLETSQRSESPRSPVSRP